MYESLSASTIPRWRNNPLIRYAAILFRDCEDEYIDPTLEELEKRPKPKKLPKRLKKEPHKPGPDKGTHLNYVTRADTLRHSIDAFWWYPLHQGWKALFYYMFNAILVNAFIRCPTTPDVQRKSDLQASTSSDLLLSMPYSTSPSG